MNCLAFERLLDAHEPARLPDAALVHARTCEHCARSLARARSLEAALARAYSPVLAAHEAAPGEAFTARVMARVAIADARGTRWLAMPDAMPWWVRAAAEPGVVLASIVAALLLWKADAWLAATRAWGPALGELGAHSADSLRAWGWGSLGSSLARGILPAPGAPWPDVLATAFALSPFVALAGYAAWRLGERWVALVARPLGLPRLG